MQQTPAVRSSRLRVFRVVPPKDGRGELVMSTIESLGSQALEAHPSPTVLVDAQGKVVAWNAAMVAVTGKAAEDVIGKKSWVGFGKRRHSTLLDQALAEGAPVQGAIELKGGSFRVSAVPFGFSEESGVIATLEPEPSGEEEEPPVIAEAKKVLEAMAHNDFTCRMEGSYDGHVCHLAEAINLVQDRLLHIQEIVQNVASGDLHDLENLRELGRRSENDKLLPAFVTMMGNLQRLIDEMTHMAEQHDAGDIDVVVSEEAFQGALQMMAQGVNGMVAGHIAVNEKAMACIAEFGHGNFDAQLEPFPGKKAFINETIESLRGNLRSVSDAIGRLTHAAQSGRLDTREDVSAFQGDWAVLVQGLNAMLDGILAPVADATSALERLAERDLRARVTSDFAGDHARIKNSVNTMASALEASMAQVAEAVDQISAASLPNRSWQPGRCPGSLPAGEFPRGNVQQHGTDGKHDGPERREHPACKAARREHSGRCQQGSRGHGADARVHGQDPQRGRSDSRHHSRHQRHCIPDQPACPQRCGGGRSRRGCGTRLLRGRRRGCAISPSAPRKPQERPRTSSINPSSLPRVDRPSLAKSTATSARSTTPSRRSPASLAKSQPPARNSRVESCKSTAP